MRQEVVAQQKESELRSLKEQVVVLQEKLKNAAVANTSTIHDVPSGKEEKTTHPLPNKSRLKVRKACYLMYSFQYEISKMLPQDFKIIEKELLTLLSFGR